MGCTTCCWDPPDRYSSPFSHAIVGKRPEIGAAGLAIAAEHSEIGAARFAIGRGHTEIGADNHAVMCARWEAVAARSEAGAA